MKSPFTGYKGTNQVEERQKVTVRDIVGVPFTIDAIRIKDDMATKFGNMDTAIVDITINDTPSVLFATQKLLFEKFEFLHDEMIDLREYEFIIERKTSKTGNPYYDIDEYVE